MPPMTRHDLKVRGRIIRDSTHPDRLLLTIQSQTVLELNELRIALEESPLVAIDKLGGAHTLRVEAQHQHSGYALGLQALILFAQTFSESLTRLRHIRLCARKTRRTRGGRLCCFCEDGPVNVVGL